MSSQILIETAGRISVLVAAFGIAAVTKMLTLVLRTWIEQASRTRRLIRALEDSKPNQRPEIIMACSHLEGISPGKPSSQTADRALSAQVHLQPPLLTFQNKNGREHHKD